MGIFLELNIADNHPGLADSATSRAHRICPAGVRLDVRGAAALALDGRHDGGGESESVDRWEEEEVIINKKKR